jgi:hypothetical protein
MQPIAAIQELLGASWTVIVRRSSSQLVAWPAVSFHALLALTTRS